MGGSYGREVFRGEHGATACRGISPDARGLVREHCTLSVPANRDVELDDSSGPWPAVDGSEGKDPDDIRVSRLIVF